ncbi:cytidylate kinase [Neisseria gonorrhoeae]|uniref:(d)CMP kinase n=1 Tax=Neisseria gonorrhoeae TaxID=485 RepID=A0A378VYT6_NEIGO|nr:cytidylate kinase [Neisseria gonorrhoeae]
MGASAVAQWPKVRAALLQRQRDFLTEKDWLPTDGTPDRSSSPKPNSNFLTAESKIRAERRAKQIGIPCEGFTFERILSDIETRDEADRNRKVAP